MPCKTIGKRAGEIALSATYLLCYELPMQLTTVTGGPPCLPAFFTLISPLQGLPRGCGTWAPRTEEQGASLPGPHVVARDQFRNVLGGLTQKETLEPQMWDDLPALLFSSPLHQCPVLKQAGGSVLG